MKSHPMSAVDAAWYHIDGPANTAVITSIALTRKPLDFDKVKAVYAARLAQFERFRCRVVEPALPLGTPHWEEMPDFEIGQQMHQVALPAPGGKAALAALVSAKDYHYLVKCHNARNTVELWGIMARTALLRTESRGDQYREDYPLMDNDEWLKWLVVRLVGGEIRITAEDIPFGEKKWKHRPKPGKIDQWRKKNT